jgi:SAM-dependent methyltransferase
MNDDLNPQARQMADESMVRTLAAQAEAMWPQELPLLRRYPLPEAPRMLDAGCGTGEASRRLAEAFPGARVLGVDILDTQVFAAIWAAWRDGYVDVIAEHIGAGAAEAAAHFDDQIATIRDPASYAAWLVPVVAGVVPRA